MCFLELGKQVESPSPVEIGFTREGWFSLRMPMLLPKKERGSAAFVRMLLLPALRRFFQGKPSRADQPLRAGVPPRLCPGPPRPALRDHDNIETNMAADCVALYVMEDDNPAVCSQYECSAKGDRERTEIYVVPETEFPQWLLSEKSMPEEGGELLKKSPLTVEKNVSKRPPNGGVKKTYLCTPRNRLSNLDYSGSEGPNSDEESRHLVEISFLREVMIDAYFATF